MMESDVLDYGIGLPPSFYAPQHWHPVPRWKWVKRLRGYRWERWVAGPDAEAEFPGSTHYIEYATTVDHAKDFLRENFDDTGRQAAGAREEGRTGSYIVGLPRE